MSKIKHFAWKWLSRRGWIVYSFPGSFYGLLVERGKKHKHDSDDVFTIREAIILQEGYDRRDAKNE